MSDESPLVPIGKIGRPHGVRGEARVFLFNPDSTTLTEGLQVFLEGNSDHSDAFVIDRARYADRFVIVKFEGIDDRDEMDAFKHAHLAVAFDDLPALERDQFYHIELIDAEVYVAESEDADRPAEGQAPIGQVDRFFATGANDVMVVRLHSGDELFVPLVEHAVSLLDFEAHRVLVQPLEIWTPAED